MKVAYEDMKLLAPFICCQVCDKEVCHGRDNCIEIKNFIEQKKNEVKNDE